MCVEVLKQIIRARAKSTGIHKDKRNCCKNSDYIMSSLWKSTIHLCGIITQKSHSPQKLYLICQHAENSSFLFRAVSKGTWFPDTVLLSLIPRGNCSACNLMPCTFNPSCVYQGLFHGCARADSKSGSCHSLRKSSGKPLVWLKKTKTLQSLSAT